MTNAEKYLKDETKREELLNEYQHYLAKNEKRLAYFSERGRLDYFLIETVKPTLTEDERVILRNIKEYNKIGRDDTNDLYIVFDFKREYRKKYYFNMFRHLFQFIKERRRI